MQVTIDPCTVTNQVSFVPNVPPDFFYLIGSGSRALGEIGFSACQLTDLGPFLKSIVN